MERPKVSIVTVGMNHLRYINDLYKSLYVDDVPKVSFESIYVDNCSTDGSVDFLRENYPQVKIIVNDKPKGFGENNNIGVFASCAEYVAIINPDVVVQSGSIDRLYEYAESNKHVGVIVPQLLNPDRSVQYAVRGFISPKMLFWRLMTKGDDKADNSVVNRYLCKDMDYDVAQPINWSIGAALFMHRDIYSSLVGFDQDYFLYMEDEDLCLRAWKKGLPVVYLPESKMIHNHLRASAKLGKRAFMHLKSMLTFFRKHGFSIPDYALNYNK